MRSTSCTVTVHDGLQPYTSAAAEATSGMRAGGGLPGNVTEASAMEQLALAMWAPGARAECARAPPAARRPRDPGARAPMPAPAPAWCLPGSRGRAGSHGRVGRAGHAQGGQNPDQNPGPGARAPRWFLEGASTSTRENAVLSLDVAERRGALDRRARPAAAAPCRGPACHPGACLARCLRPRSARGARAPCSQRPSPHPGRRREAAPGRGRSARRRACQG